ncbi:MAG: hypothetical protein J3K34DRAFT_457449 [Monoraphidium minutum]|nr:MAG: hypothetical protein J3K34DRAFT_457449 [Monoraphidium minutum]
MSGGAVAPARVRIKGRKASVIRFFFLGAAHAIPWIVLLSQMAFYSKMFGPQVLLQLNIAYYLPSIPTLMLAGALEPHLEAQLGPAASILARLTVSLTACAAVCAAWPFLPGRLAYVLWATVFLGAVSSVAFSVSYQLVAWFRAADTIALGIGAVGSGPVSLLIQIALQVGPRPHRWQWIALFEVAAAFVVLGLVAGASLLLQYWRVLTGQEEYREARRPLLEEGGAQAQEDADEAEEDRLDARVQSLLLTPAAMVFTLAGDYAGAGGWPGLLLGQGGGLPPGALARIRSGAALRRAASAESDYSFNDWRKWQAVAQQQQRERQPGRGGGGGGAPPRERLTAGGGSSGAGGAPALRAALRNAAAAVAIRAAREEAGAAAAAAAGSASGAGGGGAFSGTHFGSADDAAARGGGLAAEHEPSLPPSLSLGGWLVQPGPDGATGGAPAPAPAAAARSRPVRVPAAGAAGGGGGGAAAAAGGAGMRVGAPPGEQMLGVISPGYAMPASLSQEDLLGMTPEQQQQQGGQQRPPATSSPARALSPERRKQQQAAAAAGDPPSPFCASPAAGGSGPPSARGAASEAAEDESVAAVTVEVLRGTWQVVLAGLLSSTLLNCVFPFFTYLPSSGMLGEQLPQCLFYSRIMAEITGRLLPRRRALMVASPGALLCAALALLPIGAAFFAYLQAPSSLLYDPLSLALVVALWAVGGYVNTISYILAPSLVHPKRCTKASALMALTYQIAHIVGLVLATGIALALYGDIAGDL